MQNLYYDTFKNLLWWISVYLNKLKLKRFLCCLIFAFKALKKKIVSFSEEKIKKVYLRKLKI